MPAILVMEIPAPERFHRGFTVEKKAASIAAFGRSQDFVIWRETLLDILRLLSHLLDQHLHFDRCFGGFGIGGFRTQRIGFAVHFLE